MQHLPQFKMCLNKSVNDDIFVSYSLLKKEYMMLGIRYGNNIMNNS